MQGQCCVFVEPVLFGYRQMKAEPLKKAMMQPEGLGSGRGERTRLVGMAAGRVTPRLRPGREQERDWVGKRGVGDPSPASDASAPSLCLPSHLLSAVQVLHGSQALGFTRHWA